MQILTTSLFLVISNLIFGCTNCETCNCLQDNEKIIQSYQNDQYLAKMIKTDDGVFGETCRLVVYNLNGNIIEEIGLRGEMATPKIDRIDNKQIFVVYSYTNIKNKTFNFEDMVLGEALLDSSHLNFEYYFENRK